MDAYYKAVELIGQGTYGNVYKCRVIHTPGAPSVDWVAVKKFKKPGAGSFDVVGLAQHDPQNLQNHSRHLLPAGYNKCRRELAILKLISEDGSQHPHLVRLLDHFVTQTNKLCLVFEYIDTTLLDVMDAHPNGMMETRTKSIIFQVLQGLRHLHKTHNLMHRDVKPENVLVDRSTGIVKLCDMGFAREDEQGGDEDGEHGGDCGTLQDMTQYVSTRWYRAPELLLRRPKYSKSIDVWAVGCLVVEMLAGKPAFPAKNDVGVLGMISRVLDWRGGDECARLSGDPGTKKRQSAHMDQQAVDREKARRHAMWLKGWLASLDENTRDFILSCLRPDSDARATVDELLDHPWISMMEWMDETYDRGVRESMHRTASIHATVMACKRLRMALLNKDKKYGPIVSGSSAGRGVASGNETSINDKDAKRYRQHSMVVQKSSSKALNLIKHAYYTPQVIGVGVGSSSGLNHPPGSIGAVHHQKKSNSYWLDTPGGAMVSPKLNAGISDQRSMEVSNSVDNAIAASEDKWPGSKRSLAKRLLDKLKF